MGDEICNFESEKHYKKYFLTNLKRIINRLAENYLLQIILYT
jgi:hypothetical protein